MIKKKNIPFKLSETVMIKLQNFRCHRNSKYEIPENGLILVSGNYGVGKSSLLNAIVYAFYGSKAVRCPYSHGKSSCCVRLKFRGLDITRTSKPNRLIVNFKDNEYESEAAQGVIEETLGMNCEEFLASSYVIQRKTNSVLSMTPTEQVQFIETLVFSDNEKHKTYKQRFKKYAKECREKKIQLKGQENLLKRQIFESKQKLPKEPPPDPKGRTLENIRKEQKKIRNKIKESSQALEKLSKEKEEFQQEKSKKLEIKNKIKELESQIDSYNAQLTELGDQITEEDIHKKEKELTDTKLVLSSTRFFFEYIDLDKKVKRLEKDYLKDTKKKLAILKRGTPPDVESLKQELVISREQQLKNIENLRSAQEIKKKKEQAKIEFQKARKLLKPKPKSSKVLIRRLKEDSLSLEQSIKEIQNKIEDYTRKEARQDVEDQIYQCPSCSVKLSLLEGKLYPFEEQEDQTEDYGTLLLHEKTRIRSIELKFNKLKQTVNKLEELQPFLNAKVPKVDKFDPQKVSKLEEKIWEIQNKQKEISKLSDIIQKKKFPPTIQELQRETKNKRSKFPQGFRPGLDISTLEKKSETISFECQELHRKLSEQKRLKGRIQTREKQLKKLRSLGKRMLKPSKERDIDSEITNLQKKIMELNEILQESMKTYGILQKRDEYRRDLENVLSMENSLKSLKKRIRRADSDLKGALGLVESAKEAEILSLERAVSSINQHAKIYLSKMFGNEIGVRLESIKQTKTKGAKIKMNVAVEYKGYKYSSIDELSGGERQMCELSFLLAVNDMLGSRILLLDECLNNLDSETNTDVLLQLKDLVGDRLVLVVSHEAVQGVFDSILEI